MRLTATGSLIQQGEAAAPSWDSTFANLPDAIVGVPYGPVNLTDYGANLEEVHAIGTSRAVDEPIWPTGLSLDTETGILSGTPTVEDEVAVVTVVGVNGTFDEAADWAFRSTLPGVFTKQDFPDNASVRDVSDNMSGTPERSQWDSNVKLYGNGSCRMEILDTDAYPGHPANYRQPLIGGTWDNPVALAVGDEVWSMCSMRFNRTEVQWAFAQTGGGTIHNLKLMMLDEAGGSSSFQVTNAVMWAICRGFTGVGTGIGWDETFDSLCRNNDIKWEPEIDRGASFLDGTDPGLPSGDGAGPWTPCQQERARYGGLFSYLAIHSKEDGFPDPLTGGMFMPFDWWFHIMAHIKRLSSGSTLVEHYAAYHGQDWTLMRSAIDATGGPYEVANYTNSHTNMAAEPGVRPLCQRWYDGLITREGPTRIPAPGFTS